MRGEIKGKLAYMPPEQALGEMVDRRSDIYATGVVLWEALVGRRLFSARSEEDLVRQIFEARIDPPSLVADVELSSALDHVVLRALSKERDSRWLTAEQMAAALGTALSPARHEEVAHFVRSIARADLADRRTLIDTLDANASALEGETQTLQTILTGRAARGARAASPADAMDAPTRSQPVRRPAALSAPLVPSGSRASEKEARSSQRRELRRKRRRMKVVVGIMVAIAIILFLMIIALILGRHAR